MDAPRSVEEVFEDFNSRRNGLIKALTVDVDKFYLQCDPEKDNLCLYGFPDATWEVQLPADEVPPELPEPALGINFARDGMQKKDWLALVAVHSDAWLMAVAFYYGAKFDKVERDKLFKLVNNLPTVYETLAGKGTKSASKKKKPASDDDKKPAKKQKKAAQLVAADDPPAPPPVTGFQKPSAGRLLVPSDEYGSLQGAKIELFWPDDGLWYRGEVVSINMRNRSAKVVYATGDVETMTLDEIAADGHMNVLS